ncbi:MAG: TonB-dependent receptor [Aquificae bacterium]|nr:TonB-dependent receptor [Aquificota bacterium]
MRKSPLLPLFLSALFSSFSFSQEEIVLEEVEVVSREEEKNLEVPVRVDTVPKEELELDKPLHPKESLNSLPGVLITQVAAVLGHATAIRLPINYGPYYLYLQDGIPVQSTGFFNHNALWWTSFLTSLEGVEVLKGVGTAIYGSDAIGAVVNVKSEEPSWSLRRNFFLEGGSYGTFRGILGVSDAVGESSAYLLKASFSTSDGWRDKTGYDRWEAIGKYNLVLSENSTLKLQLIANRLDAQMAGYLDYETFKTNPEDSGLPPDLTDPYRKVDMVRLSAEYEKLFGENKLSVIPYLRYNRNQYVATWIPKVYPENDTKTYTAGLLTKYKFSTPLGETFVGLDLEYTYADSHYYQTRPTQVIWGKEYPQGDIYKYTVDFISVAPYLHHEKWVGRFKLSFGLRADYARYDYDNKLTPGEFGVWYRPDDRTDEFSHVSPKLGLLYKINETNALFLRYANGFRIPQASTLYRLKVNTAEYKLDPEIADMYEVGVKGAFRNFSYSVSYYYMTIKDMIVTNRDAITGITYRENAGKTEHKGIEIGAQISLLSGQVKLRGAYSYSLHKYLDYTSGGVVYDGKYMAMAPKHLGNARLIIKPRFLRGFSAELEYQYVGSYYMDDLNTKKYGGHELWNLRADYKLNKYVSFFGKVLNLTDELYAETANIAYGKERYRPGYPRTVYVGLKAVW